MQSMTGYGRCLLCRDGRELLLELKSVNHRFLDIAFRLPRQLMFLEDPIRKQLTAGGLSRGHVDVFAAYQNNREDAKRVLIDHALLQAAADAFEQARALAPDTRKATVAEMLSLSGALTVTQGEEDMDAVTQLAQEALQGALAQLLDMRMREGRALRADLLEHLQKLDALIKRIAVRAPKVPEEYRQRLSGRMQEWEAQMTDPQRIAQETALMADRCAIDEELSRLESHMNQFREGVQQDGEMGRRLEFLLQEMNREVNTIGSKASDEAIAGHVVDAKCELEKLREQVQNVV